MTLYAKTEAGSPGMPAPGNVETRAGPIQLINSGEGPAFMALHGGLGGCDQSWLLAQALLPDVAAWRVLAVSRPGYLDTPLSVGQTPEEQADAYAVLLDALKIDRVVMAAVSAGGPSALQFAIRHPDRCRAVILVSAATGKLDVPPRVLRRLRLMTWLLRIPGMQAGLRHRALRDPAGTAARSISDPAVLKRTLADPQAGPLFMALQESVMTRSAKRLPGTRNDTRRLKILPEPPLERVEVPVLAIHGTADPVVPFDHARRVASSIRSASLHAIEGGEHVALFTHLDEVREAVGPFFARIPA